MFTGTRMNRWGSMLLAVVGAGLALAWARERDPFERMSFKLRTAEGRTVGIAVMPRPAARFPVVVYFYGSGGHWTSCGHTLRLLAEGGCAAVAIEYCQTNQARFEKELAALDEYLGRQRWAQSNAVAWVGYSLGARRTLSGMIARPELQPELYVRIAGGVIPEMQPGKGATGPAEVGEAADKGIEGPRVRCPTLLVHGERDEVFPVKECERVEEWLKSGGTPVETRVLKGLGHSFGEEFDALTREVGWYCARRLPVADAAGRLRGCGLSAGERERFNRALWRAGKNRGELWSGVVSLREPERRTAMMTIGGLADYDLAHMTSGQVREVARTAWKARREFLWSAGTPLAVFEKFTANPRIYEEPLERWQAAWGKKMRRVVKYCGTTEEASDAVWRWMHRRATFVMAGRTTAEQNQPGRTPRQILADGGGECEAVAVLYACLARAAGLAVRPAMTIWPTLESNHYWVETWSAEEGGWHAHDCTSAGRPYGANWMLRVPKAVIQAPTGERGGWNARTEQRWEAYTNTIGLFYPSGRVRVRVTKGGAPAAGQRVAVEVLRGGLTTVDREVTGESGDVVFSLGKSARHPYRVVLDGQEEPDWQWVEVESNRTVGVALSLEVRRPVERNLSPPALLHTNAVPSTPR